MTRQYLFFRFNVIMYFKGVMALKGIIIRNKYHMVFILFYGFLINIIMIASYALLISTIKDDMMIILSVLIVLVISILFMIILFWYLSQWCIIIDDKLCFRNNFVIHKEVSVNDIKKIEFVDIKAKNDRIFVSKPVMVIKLTNNKIKKYEYIMSKRNDHFCIDLNQENYNLLKQYLEKNESYLLDMISTGEFARFNIER